MNSLDKNILLPNIPIPDPADPLGPADDDFSADVEVLADTTTSFISDLPDLDMPADSLWDFSVYETTESFDFTTLVRSTPLSSIGILLADLEAAKPHYIALAAAEGKRNPRADFYNTANSPLFDLRKEIQVRLDEAEQTDDDYLIREAKIDLENLTELLFRFNYGMAKSYVRQFTSKTSPEDSADFQGAANVGLMYAIRTFDPDKGKFGSWSYKPIQRAVLKAVRDADFSNMTSGDFEKRPKIRKAWKKIYGTTPPAQPDYALIAKEAGVTVDLVKRVMAAPYIGSLNLEVSDEGHTELGDLIPDSGEELADSVISSMEASVLLKYGLPMLTPRERYVLTCRWGLHGEPPEALNEVGQRLGLSREAVRLIAAKGLARLLHPMVLGVLARGGTR